MSVELCKNTFYNNYIYMSFPQCLSSYVVSENNYVSKFDHICNTDLVFLQCVLSYASLEYFMKVFSQCLKR